MQIAVVEFARTRGRHGGRQLGRVRPRDAVPGRRPAARAEGGLRHGRDDAARRRPGEAARGHARRARSSARPSSTSATATVTRSTTSCAAGSKTRAWSAAAPRPTSAWSRWSSCPITPSSSPPSTTRSSTPGPTGPSRCSASSSAPPRSTPASSPPTSAELARRPRAPRADDVGASPLELSDRGPVRVVDVSVATARDLRPALRDPQPDRRGARDRRHASPPSCGRWGSR